MNSTTRSSLYPQDLERPGAFTGYVHTPLRSGLRPGDRLHRTSYFRTHPAYRIAQDCVEVEQLQQLLENERQADDNPLRWSAPKFIGETVAESVRTRVNPRLPSHLECNFVFLELGHAAIFKRIYGKPEDHLFQVSVVGRWAQREMNLFSAVAGAFRIRGSLSEERIATAIRDAFATAERYWRGERLSPTLPEILVDGEVIVQRDLGPDVPLPDGATLPDNIDQM